MAVYTVHEPPMKDESPRDPDRFVFVREGFSFWAFLLAPLWMLWHRLWLVFLAYVLLSATIELLLTRLGMSTAVTVSVGVLLALLVGLEAASLRRFTLARRRWRSAGIVVGDDVEAAERRFFDLWVNESSRHSPRPASVGSTAAPVMARSSTGIVGLFPEPGTQR